MAQARRITSLLCPSCKSPDTLFMVHGMEGGRTVLVDCFCCRYGQKSPEDLKPTQDCRCTNCGHVGKLKEFAVKHTRQPGEKFRKDELEFLNEPDKGLVEQPLEMKATEEKEQRKCRSRRRK